MREVTFVYLGSPLPKYVVPSLELAREHSGLRPHLIAKADLAKHLPAGVKFTGLESFYDSEEFSEASNNVLFSHSALGGFWLKTLERFFVLGQYQTYSGENSVFHAEIDQLLFRVDKLIDRIEASNLEGFFVPRHNQHRAVASIVYSNSPSKFKSLLEFASSGEPFDNEMNLIANWIEKFPQNAHYLPTIHTFLQRQPGSLGIQTFGGISDAAQLGQWVGGIDPRNVPLLRRPANRFVDLADPMLASRDELMGLRFKLDKTGQLMAMRTGQSEVAVYNLHLHSKVHHYLAKKIGSIPALLASVNAGESRVLPGARSTQIAHHSRRILAKIRKITLWRVDRLRSKIRNLGNDWQRPIFRWVQNINRYLRRRPSSEPFISGDTFRSVAQHIWEANRTVRAESVKKGDVIFCESEKAQTETFLNVVRKLQAPVVLLLGNSDHNHGGEISQVISALPVGSVVFAQNLVRQGADVYPLPIGLENAWRANHGRTRPLTRLRKTAPPKSFRVLCSFSELTNLPVRTAASGHLSGASVVDRPGHLHPRAHQRALSRYAFVASPPGNGADCHRTWEAIYLRCVPIVLRSPMTEAYEMLGLPIWVVDSFEELLNVDEKSLEAIYREMLPAFDAESVWFRFWLDWILREQNQILNAS